MMGTLAKELAAKKIPSSEECYWAEVEGDIENVKNILKITQIRVTYHLRVPRGKTEDARQAMASYLAGCPAAQSVIGCIDIRDEAVIEETER
jgi:hypothetical protein